MRYYAVIDTNVLVSAVLKRNSVPGEIIKLAYIGTIIPVLSDSIVKEYRDVLSRPKFSLPEEVVEGVVLGLVDRGIFVTPRKLDVVLPDPKDVVFFEVTMEQRRNGETHLVTGNGKHFPAEPFIVTPRQMLDIIMNEAAHEARG